MRIRKSGIDPELRVILESEADTAEEMRNYLIKLRSKQLQGKIDEQLQKEIDRILYGSEGGYNIPTKPSVLLDFASLHPSMGFRNYKPRNHYERMMARRRKCSKKY